MTTTQRTVDSPLGPLTLVARDGVLAGIYHPDHRTRPDREGFGREVATGFGAVEEQLDAYFAGDLTTFAVPTVREGDAFARRVWARLDRIPYGGTTTYGAIARELGGVGLARRVGGAVGANPLSIVCPCHRVVGSTGALTGYAGGLPRKRALLEREGVPLAAGADRVLAAPALTLF